MVPHAQGVHYHHLQDCMHADSQAYPPYIFERCMQCPVMTNIVTTI